MSLMTIETDVALPGMHAIGSVSNLGSEVLEGDVQAYALGTHGSPGDAVTAGYFAVTPGSFRMVYPFHEQASVVQGSVTLTDVASGTSRHYRVGDSWFVTKGTEVIWKVEGGVFMKHYLAVA
jgi:uncharacterized cupin superfamily protein